MQPWNYHQAMSYEYAQAAAAGQQVEAHSIAEGETPNPGLSQHQYEFSSSHPDAYQGCSPLTGDIFQPEEIFQLDQPLKPANPFFNNNHIATPSNILDLDTTTRSKFHGQEALSENTKNSTAANSFSHNYPESGYPFFETPPPTAYACDPSNSQHLMKTEPTAYAVATVGLKKREDWTNLRNSKRKFSQTSPMARSNGQTTTVIHPQTQIEVDYTTYDRATYNHPDAYQSVEFSSSTAQNPYLSTNYANYNYASDHYSQQAGNFHSY